LTDYDIQILGKPFVDGINRQIGMNGELLYPEPIAKNPFQITALFARRFRASFGRMHAPSFFAGSASPALAAKTYYSGATAFTFLM